MTVHCSGNLASLHSGLTEAVLLKDGESWYLSSIRDRSSGTQLVEGEPGNPLWSLRVSTPLGVSEVSSPGLESSLRAVGRSGIELVWEDLRFEGSECSLSLDMRPERCGYLEMGLRFRSDPPLPLSDLDFPVVGGLVVRDSVLYAPYGYGKALPFSRGTRYRGEYPSHHCTMQFVAWNAGPSSLYLGFHDPSCAAKTMAFSAEPVPTLKCTLPIPGMGDPKGKYVTPYPTVLGAIRGDWYDAARSYRSWAIGQQWSSAGPMAQREVPDRLKKVALWLQASGSPEDVVPKALEFNRFFGVPLAMHWYVWHEIPFDDHYPEYFPPKKGFAAAVDRLSKDRILVMPYINARLWDPATKSWGKENAEAAAAKNADLEKYVEVYGSKVPLSPMCPLTELWQRKITGIVKRLSGECHVHGVYLDQIAAAAPKLCHDRTHGHEIGGGSWWVDGYRRMLRRVRRATKAIDPEFFITTESNAEPWNDLIDALLMCNSTEGELAPIYPVVYGDYVLTFGAYISRGDLQDSWAFRTKVSQMFLWGTQLGWLGPEVLEYRLEAEYLRSLARTRASAYTFLRDGEMLRPPRVEAGDVRLADTKWELWNRTWGIQVPVAQASAWRAPDGSIGVVACNMDDASADLAISFDPKELGLSAKKSQRLAEKSELSTAEAEVRGNRLHLRRSLEPRSSVCLSSGRRPNAHS